jgi:hypothetical protein
MDIKWQIECFVFLYGIHGDRVQISSRNKIIDYYGFPSEMTNRQIYNLLTNDFKMTLWTAARAAELELKWK